MIPLELAHAKTETEVKEFIEKEPYFINGRWKALGGIENNYGVILNQQAHPVAAIIEKIINSSDALLTKECRKRGIDPESKDTPKTMFKAVEAFYGIKDGNLNNLDSKTRRQLAENIRIIADGDVAEPNIIVADLGEGQHPADFENTFLALLQGKSRKRYIPFVQGIFYMGGSGVLPNCGKYGYQLIISKKAPELVENGKHDVWGWTLIRKNSELKRYEYFVDSEGKVPCFTADGLNLLPDGKSLPYGTFIKMYNYQMPTKSNITADLWKKLNIFLFMSPLPVLLQETRDFKSAVMDIVFDGNYYTIEKNRDKLETDFIIDARLGQLGIKKIKIYVFRDDLKPKENFYTTDREAIFFTINGQTHGTLGRSFVRNRARKPRLASSLLVNVDCTDIKGTLQHDAFMPSRDRMRTNEITEGIEQDIENVLRTDETLKQIDLERYEKLIKKTVDDSQFANKIIGRLIQSNKHLIKYLKLGGKIANPIKRGERRREIPRFDDFPTIFKIWKYDESKGRYCKEIPINSTNSRMIFELNAPDNYFDRDWAPGELIVAPKECYNGKKQRDGLLTLRLLPLKEAKVGDEHVVSVEVTRHSDTLLAVEFTVRYIPAISPQEKVERKKEKEKPPKLEDLGLPEPKLVYRDGWEEHGWTDEDIVKIEARDNSQTPLSQLKIFINMDSDDLVDFKRRGNFGSKMVEAINKSYEIGVLIYTLTSYVELLNITRDDERESLEPENIVPVVMKGISKTMLDLTWNQDLLKELQES